MKRNISVFILLILLASSFKYRTKTRESAQPVKTAGYDSHAQGNGPVNAPMDAAIADLQKANEEMAKGNPDLYKSLWSHADDVTIFGGTDNADLKGWKAVEASLDAVARFPAQGGTYTYEKVASQQGVSQGYLIQKEHYRFSDGRKADLHVTVLFRKENNVWKIAHHHAAPIPVEEKSDKSAK